MSDAPKPATRVLGRLLDVLRAAGLVLLTLNVVAGWPGHDTPRLVLEVVATVLATIGWLGWMASGSSPELVAGLLESFGLRPPRRAPSRTLLPTRLLQPSLVLLGAAGGVVVGLEPSRAGSAYAFVAVAVAAGALSSRRAISVLVATEVAVVTSVLLGPGSEVAAIAYGAGLLAAALVGSNRSQALARLEQSELLLAETQRASSEREHGAALEERGRIAREVHDVLAHSLAGLGIQLEAAQLLLASGRYDEAAAHVARAQDLAREGTAETRRALQALRGESLDLGAVVHDQLVQYAADTGTDAGVEVALTAPVRPEAAVAVARVTQEVLTNARRHAPGAAVSGSLRADGTEVRLELIDSGPADGRVAGGSGSGYGLVGIRERAALAGGTVEAGPYGRGWRVCLTLPA